MENKLQNQEEENNNLKLTVSQLYQDQASSEDKVAELSDLLMTAEEYLSSAQKTNTTLEKQLEEVSK